MSTTTSSSNLLESPQDLRGKRRVDSNPEMGKSRTLTTPKENNRVKKVSDRIRDYELNRNQAYVSPNGSGNAMVRRKSVQALSGTFNTRMKNYLQVAKSPFDQLKYENRRVESRPPVSC